MSPEELRFDGRVAVVTGAGRGLGRAYAHALAERGAKVVVNDLGGSLAGDRTADPEPAETVAEEIVAGGGEAIASSADVADERGAASIVALGLERFGRLDVIVNNAGNMDPRGMPELNGADLSSHLDIHVLGSLNVTRAAWPHLVAQGFGRIVLTSSIGLFGGEFIAAYSTAKGATVSLGRSLALAGEPHGIRVNMLAPAAETRMVTDPELRARVSLPPLPAHQSPDPARGPDAVVPMLLVLAHESVPANGEVLVAGLGRFARIFTAETAGIVAPGLEPEGVLERWKEIVDESNYVAQTATAESVAFREGLIAGATEGSR